MRQTLVALTLAAGIALSGCATIEKRTAVFVLNRYVGVWTKPGATDDDRGVDSASCVFKSLNAQGILQEEPYRACMRSKGWVLTPVRV